MNDNKYLKKLILIMIKFSMWEDEVFSDIKKIAGDQLYNIAYQKYSAEFKQNANQYIALSHIYHSIINSANLFNFSKFSLDNKNSKYYFNDNDVTQLSIAITETFSQSLCIQYGKLLELLWDDKTQSERDKYKNIIINNGLHEEYKPLHHLLVKIKSSKVKYLRDKIFAHPLMDKKNKKPIPLYLVVEHFHEIIGCIIDDSDRNNYMNVKSKISYYINRYLVKATAVGVNKKTGKHINIIFNFMKAFKEKMMMNAEPILLLDKDKVKDILNSSLKHVFKS